jgi:hypothetical protein
VRWSFKGGLPFGGLSWGASAPSFCFIATTDGQLAITTDPAAAAGWGLDAGPYLSSFSSTAGSAGDQKGGFVEVGGSLKWLGGGQGDAAVGMGRCGQPVLDVSAGGTIGAGGRVQGGVSYTTILWQSKEDSPCPTGMLVGSLP